MSETSLPLTLYEEEKVSEQTILSAFVAYQHLGGLTPGGLMPTEQQDQGN